MKVKYLVCVCGWKSKPYPNDTLFAGLGGELSCPECSKTKKNKGIEVYGNVKVVVEEFDRREASLLLYLETCLVDQYGRVEGRRINKEEIEIIKKWVEQEFLWFGRLKMGSIQKLRGMGKVYTHYVRFSRQAWQIVSEARHERSSRMLESMKRRLVKEMIDSPFAKKVSKQCHQ